MEAIDKEQTCKYCGKSFSVKRIKRIKQKYCSRECCRQFWLTQKVEKTCIVCKQRFMSSHKDAQCCSDKCRQELRNKKHGLTISKEYWKELREFILERDNFTCQKCNAFLMAIGLDVHHLKPLYKGGGNNAENLITLCHKCHKKAHKVV